LILGIQAIFNTVKAFCIPVVAAGAAVTTSAALFIEMPAGEITSRVMLDTLSIVHVSLLWITTATTLTLAAVFAYLSGRSQRFLVACVLGAVTLMAQNLLYPRFFLGPLADADPYIFESFLPRVGEARPLFASAPEFAARAIVVPVFAMVLLGLALAQERVRAARLRTLIILTVLLLLTCGMTLIQSRWGYYLQPVAALTVAILLPGLATAARGDTGSWLRVVPRNFRTYVALALLALVTALFTSAVEAPRQKDSWCKTELRYVVQTRQLPTLLGDPDQTIFVPEDFGGEMQFFTPFRIIASNYHREAEGLRAMDKIRAAQNMPALRAALKERGVTAVLFCPSPQAEGIFSTSAKYPVWASQVSGLRFMSEPGTKPVLLKVQP
ncbi:MAG TPA: hypothetical protein VEF76_13485, partial [Patescibacteria group bacterium]|nr:hypothetical protein [Patescibacteria group bacterium]